MKFYDIPRGAIRIKIRKWSSSLIRDGWGNLTDCYWNEMVKEEILKLEEQLKKQE